MVYEQAGVADEWLFSPCLSLVTGGIYQVTYAVQTPSLTAPAVSAGSLGIFLGDSAAVSHMTMTVQPSTAYAPSTTYTTAIATFTATATGNFILGFEATNSNASDQLVMALDDINITKIVTRSINPYIIIYSKSKFSLIFINKKWNFIRSIRVE